MDIETLVLEPNLLGVMIRFSINLISLFILIRLIYYKQTGKGEFLFAYFMMGIVINLLTTLMSTVNMQIGLVLGLFAIFSILRFRTVTFTVRDMTYIFIVIGISVVNSQANIPPPVLGAIIVNSVIVLSTFILELFLSRNMLTSFNLKYNKAELLNPSLREELLKDLSAITGEKIEKVTIIEFDSVKGNAELEVFFKSRKNVPKPPQITPPAEN